MLSSTDRRRVDEATRYFKDNKHLFELFAESLMGCFEKDPNLGEFIHFIKYRIKDEKSLRAKLERVVTSTGDQDLVSRITDFAGVRIIHLHMDQFPTIHRLVSDILKEQKYDLLETPKAYCWDMEYRDFFIKRMLKWCREILCT